MTDPRVTVLLYVTSVLIVGDTEAVLIDTRRLAADARRVAGRIAATGELGQP